MPVQEDTQRHFYPWNPHIKTHEEVRSMHDPGFQSAPGVAPIYTFAIEHTHPIVPRWRDVCGQIVEKLDKAGVDWVAVECFRRAQQKKKADDIHDDTTIVITVKDLPSMTDDLRELLKEIHELSGGLFVELVRGRIWPRGYEAKDDGVDDVQIPIPYATQPPMGASIGVSVDPKLSGTLGGYVELFKEGSVKQCGLTCAHVVAPRPKGEADHKPAPFVTSNSAADSAVRVFHPSTHDNEFTMAKIRATVLSKRSSKEYLEEKRAIFGESALCSKNSLNFLRENIVRWEEKIAIAKSADREIGTVFAASGCEVLAGKFPEGGCRIDWGLIELETGRVGTNTYLDPSDDELRILREVSVPWRSCPVAKIGRTSGTTEGVINGVESCISRDSTGRKVKSMEWAIASSTTRTPFSLDGDSGAFVIDPSGLAIVGILWGGKDLGLYDTSYVTPIDVVAKHIFKTTGYHVRLPGGEDICCQFVLDTTSPSD